MKKKTVILILIGLLALVGMFSACSPEDEPIHQHSFSTEWSKDGQYHWQACSGCNEVRFKSEHDWNSGVVTLQPTETSEGVRTYTCNSCNHTRVENIPMVAHKHTFSETWTSDETHHWHQATCEHVDEVKEKAEHDWDSGEVTLQPTETSEGIRTYTCNTCRHTRVENIPMVAHKHTYSETWTSDETYHWHQATCEHTSEVKDKAEHTWDDGKVTKPATPENTGIKTYTCTVCSKTKEEEIPILEIDYTIIWKNGDTVLETDKDVPHGATPSYDGAVPTKEATPQYTYTFSGWSPEVGEATQDVIYQAQFKETLRKYTVTFYSENGSVVLDVVEVEYGSSAVYSKSTPVKNATEGHTYVFDKWVTTQGGTVEDDLANVTGNRAVYASFKEFVRTVTVYILSNNTDYGTVSVSALNNVPYESTIKVNGNTITINGQTVTARANAATAQYTYKFVNWTADATVGDDTVITANFSRSVNSYTVTWKNGNTILEVDKNVTYGTTPVYNGAQPSRESDSENNYVFSGWSPAISSVTGDITYVAQFVKVENNYTVTFYDEDGSTVLAVVVVGSGDTASYPHATPTKDPTASTVYTFEKWVSTVNGNETASLTNVTANKKVYAKYSTETRKYNVKFCDWDGKVLNEQTVEYGQSATPPQEPYRDGYRFDKWNSSYDNISEDLQITAMYIRQHTVRFVDYDNSIIDIQLVDHGCDAVKPSDPSRKYHQFVGWDTTFTNIVADLTVRAEYIRQYIVTFVDHDGTVISTDIVNSGDNATPPSNPVRTGYTFISWDQSYNNVVSDLEIVAVYEINRYTVTFKNVDGSVISTISNVAHGTTVSAPETDEIYFDWNSMKGYRFTGWKNWNETQPIVGDTTITADYSQEITTPIIAIETKEISKGTTTVEVSIYLCGPLTNIYGISLKLQYAEQLILSDGSVIVSNKLGGSASTLNKENRRYELSWAYGKGVGVNGRLEVIKITFTIDKYTDVGEYIIELLEGTYIIDANLSKIKPIIIIGHVIITD